MIISKRNLIYSGKNEKKFDEVNYTNCDELYKKVSAHNWGSFLLT